MPESGERMLENSTQDIEVSLREHRFLASVEPMQHPPAREEYKAG